MERNGTAGKNSLIRSLVARFLRLNIGKKLFLGYTPLFLLLILTSSITIYRFLSLNLINKSIIETDIPLIETTDKMVETLLAQELYGRRYVLIKSSEMRALFYKRANEFDLLSQKISNLPDAKKLPIDKIDKLHSEYSELFMKGVDHLRNPESPQYAKYERLIRKKQSELINLVKNIESDTRKDQDTKIVKMREIAFFTLFVMLFLFVLSVIFGLGAAMVITRNISGAVLKLKKATEKISEGDFEYIPDIKNKDELGDLSNAFVEMGMRLKKLENMYLDASPLTRLPGGVAIENILKKRLENKERFAFLMLDLDNFKPFNDQYGYARGNDVIQATARIIEEVVTMNGADDDFVGHIGGDDFVIVTQTDRFSKICNNIIAKFDKTIPSLYDEEDRIKGYIFGKNRQGQELHFPIMTISIAVVTNMTTELKSHIQVGEIAAELKEYAKSLNGSVYVVDQRRKGDRVQEGEKDKIIPFSKHLKGEERKDV